MARAGLRITLDRSRPLVFREFARAFDTVAGGTRGGFCGARMAPHPLSLLAKIVPLLDLRRNLGLTEARRYEIIVLR